MAAVLVQGQAHLTGGGVGVAGAGGELGAAGGGVTGAAGFGVVAVGVSLTVALGSVGALAVGVSALVLAGALLGPWSQLLSAARDTRARRSFVFMAWGAGLVISSGLPVQGRLRDEARERAIVCRAVRTSVLAMQVVQSQVLAETPYAVLRIVGSRAWGLAMVPMIPTI